MNKAILLQSDDWEGLYVNGKLIEEGHSLGQGYSRIKYFSELAKKYDFALAYIKEIYLEDDDIIWTEEVGSFPSNIKEFNNDYENMEED